MERFALRISNRLLPLLVLKLFSKKIEKSFCKKCKKSFLTWCVHLAVGLFWRRSSRGSPSWPDERGLNSRRLAEAQPAEARRACRRAALARSRRAALARSRRDSGTSKGNGRARPRQACVKSRTPGAIAQQRPRSLGSCNTRKQPGRELDLGAHAVGAGPAPGAPAYDSGPLSRDPAFPHAAACTQLG